MIWGWLHRHPRAIDITLVALLLFLEVFAALQRDHLRAAAVPLAVCETLALLWRRSRPGAVVAVVTGVVLVSIALDVWVIPLPLGVALYSLMAFRSDRAARSVGAVSIVAVAIAVLSSGVLEFGAAAARVVFLIAAALLGDSIGSRRAYIAEIEEKAARLEREQEIDARRAAAEEQARIARELHDVVAHALSVIVVQAGAADDAFDRDPGAARESIRAVDDSARAASSASSSRTSPSTNRRPGSNASTASSRACARQASTCRSRSKARGGRCLRALRCPRTGSCRKR